MTATVRSLPAPCTLINPVAVAVAADASFKEASAFAFRITDSGSPLILYVFYYKFKHRL